MRDVDWEALPATTPSMVRALLRRCLQKDRDRRLRDVGDVRIEIEELLSEPSSPDVVARGVPATVARDSRRPADRLRAVVRQ